MIKKMTIVLGICSVVLICIFSPKFVLKKQEERLIGKMKERKIADLECRKEAEKLLERIQIYAEEKGEKPLTSEDISLNLSEEYAQEKLDAQMQEIAESVRQQIEELKDIGIIFEGIDETFGERIISYHVQTYLNEKTQSVTVWKIEVEYEEQVYELCMEEQSGKLIEFYVPRLEGDKWGGVIQGKEVEVKSKSEEFFICDYITDESLVTYEIGSAETERYIRLK